MITVSGRVASGFYQRFGSRPHTDQVCSCKQEQQVDMSNSNQAKPLGLSFHKKLVWFLHG